MIGVVVTTLGKVDLTQLLRSLPEGVPAVISWQGRLLDVGILETQLTQHHPDVVVVPSGGGASAGRNAGLSVFAGDSQVSHILFPNDDTYYPSGFFHRLEEHLNSRKISLGLFMVYAGEGSARRRAGLDRWSDGKNLTDAVLKASHEPGMVVSKEVLTELGGFNEALSVGSASFLQSGEGSDLVARAIEAGFPVTDLSHDLHALEGLQETGEALRRKRIRYLPGTAFVLGRHSWMPGSKLRMVRLFAAAGLKYRSGSLQMRLLAAYARGLRCRK